MNTVAQAIPNPATERRGNRAAKEQLSVRAQHVLARYFSDHQDDDLRKLVDEGTISKERAYKILIQQARDPLTGVQRRDILPYVMEYEMDMRRETGQPFSIAFFDIDDFKSINTMFDHAVGDAVLQHSAKIIQHSARETDDVMATITDPTEPDTNVTRHGGEEFLVLYPNTTSRSARVPAERLRTSFSKNMIGVVPDQRPMTISAGIVEYDPTRHPTWETMIKEGSQMVLAAKAAGKNRIVVAGEQPEAEAA